MNISSNISQKNTERSRNTERSQKARDFLFKNCDISSFNVSPNEKCEKVEEKKD